MVCVAIRVVTIWRLYSICKCFFWNLKIVGLKEAHFFVATIVVFECYDEQRVMFHII